MVSTTAATEKASVLGQKAWERRKPAWSRNETARWLNERSAILLAWLRRREPSGGPSHSKNMGWWLQSNRKPIFDRAHKKLLACTDPAERDKLNLLEALR